MMGTFRAYFKKETTEYVRQYKYIILAAGLIAFAVANPIMLKLLPKILKSQMPADISALFIVTQKSAVQNYMNSLFQIGSLFVIFTHCSTLSEEIQLQKLVFPYSKGGSPLSLVLAKVVHYSIAIAVINFIGFLVNYYYVQILFKGDSVSLKQICTSAVLVTLYFIFNICLVTMLSSLFRKGLIGGMLVLAVNIITIPLVKLKGIGEIIPYKLFEGANAFSFTDTYSAIVFALLDSILFVVLSIIRMKKVEVI